MTGLPDPYVLPSLSAAEAGPLLGLSDEAVRDGWNSGAIPTAFGRKSHRRVPTSWVYRQLGLEVPPHPSLRGVA